MEPAVIGAAMFGGFVALAISAAGYFAAWGAMRSNVATLAARVAAVEVELSSVNEVKISIARLETQMKSMADQFRDLNASIRWMREPADGAIPGHPEISPPRRARRP